MSAPRGAESSALTGQQILEIGDRFLNPGVSPPDPLVWDHALGSVITDVDGRDYIDLASGTLITNLGHAHPRVVAAIAEAAQRSLAFYSAAHRDRALLAQRLAEITPGDLERSAFFSSGSEAVDAAIRLARLHTGRTEILSFKGAFHGRTYTSLSVSGLARLRKGLGPGISGVLHATYPTIGGDGDWMADVRRVLASESSGDVAAIIAEPYQGAGGVIIPPADFLPGLHQLADELGALLIVDEVQSLYGRTGPMFASEHSGVVGDIMIMGKPIGNGYPLSAMIARSAVCAKIGPDQFSSTHSGNPGGCAAALAVLDAFADENVLQAGKELTPVFERRLADIARTCPRVGEVRQQGLAIGIQLLDGDDGDSAGQLAKRVVSGLRDRGVIVNSPIGWLGDVLRLAPAVNMPIELAEDGLDALAATLEAS
jgi:4-aminobutyrate aminotransferase-like enzyme